MLVQVGEWFSVDEPGDEVCLLKALLGHVDVNGHQLRVRDVIGHVGLPSGEVCSIRSKKASAASVLAWLAYMDSSLVKAKVFGAANIGSDDEDVGVLLARMFATELAELIRTKGLLRRYSRTKISSDVVRGRILFHELASRGCNISQVPCESFERLTDTPINRFLSAVVARIRADSALRKGCGHLWNIAADAVCDIPPLADHRLATGDYSFDRLEEHFKLVCQIGRLLLKFKGLGETGDQRTFSFLIQVNALFENSVVKALSNGHVRADPKFNMSYPRRRLFGPATKLDNGHFQGDLLLSIEHEPPIVVDAKFRVHISPDCYFQMVTYCHLMGSDQAVLVVPKGTEGECSAFFQGVHDIVPRTITVHILGYDTTGRTVADWTRAGEDLAARLDVVVAGQPA